MLFYLGGWHIVQALITIFLCRNLLVSITVLIACDPWREKLQVSNFTSLAGMYNTVLILVHCSALHVCMILIAQTLIVLVAFT